MTEEKRLLKDRIVLDAAFELYRKNKIENVTMQDVADKAGIGVATVYRRYKTKLELAARVCAYKWKEYFRKVLADRTTEYIKNIDSIDRLEFTLNQYIDLYRNHKDMLRFNDDLNHFMHDNKNEEKLDEYHDAFVDFTDRFHGLYERAKLDGTMRTDIPEDEMSRVLFHTMMGACVHYINGFSWGSREDEDYSNELIMLKDILMSFARGENYIVK